MIVKNNDQKDSNNLTSNSLSMMIKEKVRKKQNVLVNSWHLWGITYFRCCCYLIKTERDNSQGQIILQSIVHLESNQELSQVINTARRVHQLKYLFLNKTQRELFLLQSININDTKLKLKEMNDRCQQVENNDFPGGTLEAIESIDQSNHVDRKLLRTYLRSCL